MPDTQLVSFAKELRTRAKQILVRATNTDDAETQEMMRVIAADYEKLALRAEQRARKHRRHGRPSAAPVPHGVPSQAGSADAGVEASGR